MLKEEEAQIMSQIKEETDEISRLENIEQIIRRLFSSHFLIIELMYLSFSFRQSSRKETHSLEECKDLFIRLKADFAAEYLLYTLDTLAIPVILPKVYFIKI